MQNSNSQRLYWSLSKPIKHMGLTLDEWLLVLVLGFPAIILLIGGSIKFGFCLLAITVTILSSVKRFKKLSRGFVVKSWLLANGLMPIPKYYPNLKQKIVGR